MDLSNIICWSDDHLLVINKPAEFLVLPDGYNPTAPHLIKLLSQSYGQVWPVHRLDRETSGVLVVALNAEAHRELNRQFENRQVKKIYHACVKGKPAWDQRTIKLPLRVNAGRRHLTRVDHKTGKPSITHLSVGERLKDCSLIEAIPKTGRRHQIRVHLAACGYPIIADGLYGKAEGVYLSQHKVGFQKNNPSEKPVLARLALHASALEITHPITGTNMVFEAPFPHDFEQVLKHLRQQPFQR